MSRIVTIISIALLCVGLSCTKVKDVALEYKYDYYPLEIGQSLTYSYDSVLYNPLFEAGRDTFYGQVKEEIVDTFLDNIGRKAYRIAQSWRRTDTNDWSVQHVGFAVQTQTSLERIEQNLRFVKLIFPPEAGAVWPGNEYINTLQETEYYREWPYTVLTEGEVDAINNIPIDESIHIQEVNDSGVFKRRLSIAKYGRGVGLYYKLQYNLTYEDSVSGFQGQPWEERANRGYITEWRLEEIN